MRLTAAYSVINIYVLQATLWDMKPGFQRQLLSAVADWGVANFNCFMHRWLIKDEDQNAPLHN